MEAIQTQELTKFYGKARGIRELSLQVEQGERIQTMLHYYTIVYRHIMLNYLESVIEMEFQYVEYLMRQL